MFIIELLPVPVILGRVARIGKLATQAHIAPYLSRKERRAAEQIGQRVAPFQGQ